MPDELERLECAANELLAVGRALEELARSEPGGIGRTWTAAEHRLNAVQADLATGFSALASSLPPVLFRAPLSATLRCLVAMCEASRELCAIPGPEEREGGKEWRAAMLARLIAEGQALDALLHEIRSAFEGTASDARPGVPQSEPQGGG